MYLCTTSNLQMLVVELLCRRSVASSHMCLNRNILGHVTSLWFELWTFVKAPHYAIQYMQECVVFISRPTFLAKAEPGGKAPRQTKESVFSTQLRPTNMYAPVSAYLVPWSQSPRRRLPENATLGGGFINYSRGPCLPAVE